MTSCQVWRAAPADRAVYPLDAAAAAVAPSEILLLAQPGWDPNWDFLESAAEALRSDPRTASVSMADSAVRWLAERSGRDRLTPPSPMHPRSVIASHPAGDAVAISPVLGDLLGHTLPRTVRELDAWADAGAARGLRHLWCASGGPGAASPWLAPRQSEVLDAADPASALGALVDGYRAAHCALRLGIDAEWLGPQETGVQVALVQWITALAALPGIGEIVLLRLPGSELPPYAAALSRNAKVTVAASRRELVCDVFWRPYQPNAASAAFADRPLGRRLVVTVNDLISQANPEYHPDLATWQATRRTVRRYLLEADHIACISEDVRELLLSEVPGLEPARLATIPLGVDHLQSTGPERVPDDLQEAWPQAGSSPYVLVLGNDFKHKNRDLAIKIWRAAGVADVDLVLAGLHVGARSSRAEEDRLLVAGDSAGGRIVRLSHVSTPAKEWLLANASLLLYPTSAEGFGFIPHEAARLGVPSLSTAFGPLGEFLPSEALCEGWSVAEYAARLRGLLQDERRSDAVVAAVRSSHAPLTWAAGATQLGEVFRRSLAMAPRTAGLENPGAALASMRADAWLRAVRSRFRGRAARS